MQIPDHADVSASVSVSSTEPSVPVGGLQELEGQFAFLTSLKSTFLTAVGGGDRTTDTIHTDATVPLAWEQFRLWSTNASGFYGIQTHTGNFVTAVGAGGRTTDTIHTDATAVAGWELFAPTRVFDEFNDFMGFGLKTSKGFFLTAVGGGGHNSGDTIHTDAVVAKSWETFLPYRAAAFGTGSTYGLQVWGGNAGDEEPLRGWLVATGGGGDPGPGAVGLFEEGQINELSWTLLKQPDGTYALQTANGTVLTAIDGGAAGSEFRTDTSVNAIGDSEKFVLEDNGDFTVWIRTFAGSYISLGSTPVAGLSNISRALKFRLQLFNLAPGPTG
jgi:hypothetical protein